MKSLLVLCDSFYPDSLIGAKRLSLFVHFLSSHYRVTVVRSGKLVGVPSLQLNLHKNPNVRIISFDGDDSKSDRIERGEKIGQTQVFKYKQPSKFRLFLSRIIKPFKYYKNEIRIYKKTKKVCKEILKNSSFDLVLTTFAPLGSTAVGYYLKTKHKMKWIMDVRDIMDIPSRGFAVRKINSILQKKYSKTCDAITTPTFGFKNELLLKTKTAKPVFVLYNGFFDFDLTHEHIEKSGKLTFCYTGTIHNDLCTLKPFADCLLELINEKKIDPNFISVKYAGINGKLFSKQMLSVSNFIEVIDEGYLDFQAVQKLQQTSDVFLLMVMNQKKYTGVLTGKMSEGVQCHSPLLGMVFGDLPNSELYQTINKYSLGYCYESCCEPASFQTMKEYILSLYNRKKTSINNDISIEISEKTSRIFNYKYICEILISLIESLT